MVRFGLLLYFGYINREVVNDIDRQKESDESGAGQHRMQIGIDEKKERQNEEAKWI